MKINLYMPEEVEFSCNSILERMLFGGMRNLFRDSINVKYFLSRYNFVYETFLENFSIKKENGSLSYASSFKGVCLFSIHIRNWLWHVEIY